jgi:hypothetical protein
MLPTEILPDDDVFNDFCDRDSNWGPLLFLRPDRRARMSALRTAAGALLLGLPYGLLAAILLGLCARLFSQPMPSLVQFPVFLTLGYWLVAQFTLARAWNRRAARLARWN